MTCERCGAAAVRGYRYCRPCLKIIRAEMRNGYLQHIPQEPRTKDIDDDDQDDDE